MASRSDHRTLTDSRARARELDAPVAEAFGLMASGRWVTGKSHQELAEKHGKSLTWAKECAGQAGRFLRILMTESREDIVARNAAALEAIASDAHEMDDYGSAVRAREAMAKLLGLNAPEKVQVSAGGDYEALTDEAKLAWVDERMAELQDERAKLVVRMRIVEVKG